MANLNLANRSVVRAIDAALEKTHEQVKEAGNEERGLQDREKQRQEMLDVAISRMKSGHREKFVNRMKDLKGNKLLEGRYVKKESIGKMTDAGLEHFKEASHEKVNMKRHFVPGASEALTRDKH